MANENINVGSDNEQCVSADEHKSILDEVVSLRLALTHRDAMFMRITGMFARHDICEPAEGYVDAWRFLEGDIGKMGRRLAELQAQLANAMAVMAEWTSWKPGLGILPPVKMQHGTCCCCGTCGHYHDECVCSHNEIETALTTAQAAKAEASK